MIYRITPEVANEYLKNVRSRTPSERKVVEMQRKIECGDFTPLPHIYIDENGAVVDGVSRLTAISRAGKTVEIAVQYNTPVGVVDFDTGVFRPINVRLFNHDNTNAIFGHDNICNGINTYLKTKNGNKIPLNSEIESIIRKYEDAFITIAKICDCYKTPRYLSPCVYMAISLALINGVDEEVITEFVCTLSTSAAKNAHLPNIVAQKLYDIANDVRFCINRLNHSPHSIREKQYVMWVVQNGIARCAEALKQRNSKKKVNVEIASENYNSKKSIYTLIYELPEYTK